jgi:small-conductance mechanosensitive channel
MINIQWFAVGILIFLLVLGLLWLIINGFIKIVAPEAEIAISASVITPPKNLSKRRKKGFFGMNLIKIIIIVIVTITIALALLGQIDPKAIARLLGNLPFG